MMTEKEIATKERGEAILGQFGELITTGGTYLAVVIGEAIETAERDAWNNALEECAKIIGEFVLVRKKS